MFPPAHSAPYLANCVFSLVDHGEGAVLGSLWRSVDHFWKETMGGRGDGGPLEPQVWDGLEKWVGATITRHVIIVCDI